MKYKLAVIGNPIQHSRSPWIHNQFASQCGIDIHYEKIEAPLNDFVATVNYFRQQGGHGLNITAPFKQQAFNMANEKSARAQAAKAVNTFLFAGEEKILADNTDGFGLVNDIQINLSYPLKNKRILLLGAGGAVRGILKSLLDEEPQEIILLNRTVEKAQQVFQDFAMPKKLVIKKVNELENENFDVILDATSCWHELPLLPKKINLAKDSLCYDLKYAANPTPFLHWAKENNSALIVDGMGMLIEQAAGSFMWWTGEKPNTQSVIAAARKAFYQN